MIGVERLGEQKVRLEAGGEHLVCSEHDAKRLMAAISVVFDLPLSRKAMQQIDIEPEKEAQ